MSASQHTTATSGSRVQSEAECHVFREVNAHLRATEQKHLQVSVGFISVTALALSFLVPKEPARNGWTTVFHSWTHVIAYVALAVAGCATMFAQHHYRGWKKDYLLAAKKLVYSWPIEAYVRVNWMRADVGPYTHGDRPFFRLAGDNVLFWFVLIITSSIVAMLFASIAKLTGGGWIAWLAIITGGTIYLALVVYITAGGVRRKVTLEDNWDAFCERVGRA